MSCTNVQHSWNSAWTVLDKQNVYSVYDQVCQDKGTAMQDMVYNVRSIVNHRKQVAAPVLVCKQIAGAEPRNDGSLNSCFVA